MLLREIAVPVHAGEPADPRKKIDMPAMTDLSKVSRQCVACHAAYRIR
ncbi:MAG: hypothetical protein WBP86_03045 [Thiobacillaceae bacterium]